MRRRPFQDEPDGGHDIPPVLLTFVLDDWAEWADVPLVHDDELRPATPFFGGQPDTGHAAMVEVRIAALPDAADRHLERAAFRWCESRRQWAAQHEWPGDGVDRLVDEGNQLEAWERAHPRRPA